jgi:mannose/fructose/N-acetylgalactosamine-specific phosphotransferase system component IID
MENRLENVNSMLQYKLVMLNIISKLNESSKQEKMEDLQSHIGFSNIMSNIMLLIRSNVNP